MDHKACVYALAEKGASNQSIKMVSAFLQNRTMQIKSGAKLSKERKMNGGSPQGTKLGGFLFCITVDDIVHPQTVDADTPTQETGQDEQENEEDQEQVQDQGAVTAVSSTPISAVPDQYAPDFELSYSSIKRFVNPHGFRRKSNILRDTVLEDLPYLPGEPDEGWNIMYIDDLNIGERLDVKQGHKHITTNKEKIIIRAKKAESDFKTIETNCSSIGMKINSSKTQLLCISGDNNADVTSFADIDEQE